MKLIIIEDELDILQGMKEAVAAIGANAVEIFAVTNAEDAWEIIKLHKPEIIISDIVLPQKSGIDLLQNLQIPDYNPKIIMVSVYSDFQYAQRSMQLGAMDYLLKPFSKEAFSNKIKHVIEIIEDEWKNTQFISGQMKQAELGKKLLLDKFLLSLCMSPTLLQEHIYHRLQMWELTWLANANFSVIALDLLGQMRSGHFDKEMELKSFSVGNITEEVLADFQPSVIFKNIHHNWIIITARESTEKMIETIKMKVQQYQRISLGFGISERQFSFQSISTAYEQALKALKMVYMTPGNFFQAYVEERQAGNEHNQISFEAAANWIVQGDLIQISETVELLVRHFVTIQEVKDPQDVSKKCLEWILNLHGILRDQYAIPINQIPMSLWEGMEQCAHLEQLKSFMIDYLAGISKRLSSHLSHATIEKAKRIIQSQLTYTISLQDLAQQLLISPVWLSQLFKKETGVNFMDYVTELRIEQAKGLLRESQLKIYEIAESVGYQDLQYFGQLFKKKTGYTPKEYRSGK